jgi:hypothetical protein
MRSLSLVFLLLTSALAVGQPSTTPIRSQAACTNVAEVRVADAYGEGITTLKNGRTARATYRAHYNADSEQCLIRIETTIAAAGDSPEIVKVTLYEGDPKANKTRGALFRLGDKVTQCTVGDALCASVEEWELLAAPLLR